jgi:hypothetical protein
MSRGQTRQADLGDLLCFSRPPSGSGRRRGRRCRSPVDAAAELDALHGWATNSNRAVRQIRQNLTADQWDDMLRLAGETRPAIAQRVSA